MSEPGAPAEAPASVLVVDDDDALRLMLVSLMQAQGHEVRAAADRHAALAALATADAPPPAVLLLDLGLPPAEHAADEGLAVLDAAVEHGAKVIVLTGQDGESAALAAISRGAFDFLPKPASAERLVHAVERAMVFSRNEAALRRSGDIRLSLHAPAGKALREVRDDAELKLLREVLDTTAFNIHETARRLGVKREQVYYLLNKHGISRPPGRAGDDA